MSLNRFFHKTYPSLDWIQVEVSSYCNAACIYCPHAAYKNNWQNRFLPVEVFKGLIPAFKKTKLVYLQGWGEPFTHPLFFDMLQLAKKAGCMVGTTTNGTLIDQKSIDRMVNERLDIIGFSLAGVDEKNDSIRKGTHIKKVLDCMEKINAAKSKYGVDYPEIHVAYMLLRSGLNDLEKLSAFLGNSGADETVISSLSLVVSPAMDPESVLASGEDGYVALRRRLLEAKEASEKQGAAVYFHIVSPLLEESKCSENISRAIVVGSDGSISSCVMTQIPVVGENFYYFKGQMQRLQKLTFGNLYYDWLNDVWHRKVYRKFIRTGLRGGIPNVCQNCYKRYIDKLEKNIY